MVIFEAGSNLCFAAKIVCVNAVLTTALFMGISIVKEQHLQTQAEEHIRQMHVLGEIARLKGEIATLKETR